MTLRSAHQIVAIHKPTGCMCWCLTAWRHSNHPCKIRSLREHAHDSNACLCVLPAPHHQVSHDPPARSDRLQKDVQSTLQRYNSTVQPPPQPSTPLSWRTQDRYIAPAATDEVPASSRAASRGPRPASRGSLRPEARQQNALQCPMRNSAAAYLSGSQCARTSQRSARPQGSISSEQRASSPYVKSRSSTPAAGAARSALGPALAKALRASHKAGSALHTPSCADVGSRPASRVAERTQLQRASSGSVSTDASNAELLRGVCGAQVPLPAASPPRTPGTGYAGTAAEAIDGVVGNMRQPLIRTAPAWQQDSAEAAAAERRSIASDSMAEPSPSLQPAESRVRTTQRILMPCTGGEASSPHAGNARQRDSGSARVTQQLSSASTLSYVREDMAHRVSAQAWSTAGTPAVRISSASSLLSEAPSMASPERVSAWRVTRTEAQQSHTHGAQAAWSTEAKPLPQRNWQSDATADTLHREPKQPQKQAAGKRSASLAATLPTAGSNAMRRDVRDRAHDAVSSQSAADCGLASRECIAPASVSVTEHQAAAAAVHQREKKNLDNAAPHDQTQAIEVHAASAPAAPRTEHWQTGSAVMRSRGVQGGRGDVLQPLTFDAHGAHSRKA